jgi:hypothetical protein
MLTLRNNEDVRLMGQDKAGLIPESHIAVPGDDFHISTSHLG